MPIQKEHLWRNDITGLRALAVVPVLLYHAFPGVIPGGFFGVDVFFVISGFLISGIIFRGFKNDNFSWRTFYAKRVKRIIPNLLLVLWVTMGLGWFFMFNGEYRELGKAVSSGAGFFENFELIKAKGEGYFSLQAIRNPLTHLWSLSVEEQFYIVFPLLAMGAVALGRRLEWGKANARVLGLVAVVLITLGSFALCLGTESAKHAFYWPWTRFWEISAGIVLAYAEIVYGFHLNRGIRQGLTWLGLAMVLWAFWGYDATIRTPGLFSLFAVLGAVFLIAAKPDAWVNRTLLSWKPVTFIGLISYSLYLWHWPLLSFAQIVGGEMTNGYVLSLALVSSALVATVVFYLVEQPFRYVSVERSRVVVAMLLLGLVVTVGAGKILRLTQGLPDYGFRSQHPYLESHGIVKEVRKMPMCETDGVAYQCTKPGSAPVLLVIGDSHAQQYVNKLQDLSLKSGKNIALVASPSCWMVDDDSQGSTACVAARKTLRSVLNFSSVKGVLWIQKWGHRHYKEAALLGAGDALLKLKKRFPEKRFIVMEDNPWDESYNWRQRVLRFDVAKQSQVANWPVPHGGIWEDANEKVKANLPDEIEWLEMVKVFCPRGVCRLIAFEDSNHLSPYYLRDHATWLDELGIFLQRE